jgi:small subunit ribosomal protein S21
MGCSSDPREEITSSVRSQEQASSLRGNPRQSGGVSSLAEIKLQEGESIENALRRFKRKVQQEDIIKDIKKHSFYLKPGDKRRAKQALARKRSRKKLRREGE